MDTKLHTALVVDDNEDACRICQLGLDFIGYDVKVIRDGAAGLDLLTRESFDLLVLDLQMPGMSGVTLLHKVCALPMHNAMRIVILSKDIVAADKLVDRAVHVLRKPIDLASFMAIAKVN